MKRPKPLTWRTHLLAITGRPPDSGRVVRQFGCYTFFCRFGEKSAHHQLSFKDIWRGSSLQLFEADNYLGAGMPLFDISDGFSGVTQSITLIDHRGYFSGFHEFAQCL